MLEDEVELWTIQPIEWYHKLQKDKILFAEKSLINIDMSFMLAYQWMQQQMLQRIGKPPKPNCYPIWAWYQYNSAKKQRPDLRGSGHLEKGAKGVRIEFNKSRDDVLLSDFQLWHHPLNYWHIADTEQEDQIFDNFLLQNNVKWGDIESYTLPIKEKIEASWVKIFDMNYAPEYSASPFERKSIQATFWSLSIDEIVKVDEFIAR